MEEKIGIFWFRQDLRLHDNLAILDLIKDCDKIIPVYIFDNDAIIGSASKWWLYYSLDSLDKSLRLKNSRLFYFNGQPYKILKTISHDHKISNIYWNRLYDKYSIERDSKIKENLKKLNINVKTYQGSLINEPWKIKNKSNSFFKVFTPFWKTCLEENQPIKLLSPPSKIETLFIKSSLLASKDDFKLFDQKATWINKLALNWVPGEEQALKNFKNFKNKVIENYSDGRDRPDKNYTSKLSPYLHFGEISPERIFEEIKKKKIIKNKSKKKFLAEIGWREFSYYLLYHFKNLDTENFQKKFDKFPWLFDKNLFTRWKKGQTGFPIVDAGMRQLWETGYIHNRVRMIVASFLVKNLQIHWHYGRDWFWECLVDADLASNSASWQWVAGSGADAAPYFRIFNPVLQSKKFDPEGEYIRKYIPELSRIESKYIHSPWEKQNNEYIQPIIDLKVSREKALSFYNQISKS